MTVHFSPEIVRMIGWALLHFLWQGALVAAIVGFAFLFFRRATLRYAASVAGLLLMLALPVLTFYVLQRGPAKATEEVTAAAVTGLKGMPGILHHARQGSPAPVSESRPEIMLWLVRAWMAGVIVFSLRSAGGFVLMQRMRRVATSPITGELLAVCVSLQKRMGIERTIRYCRSAMLAVPAVVGGLRPIVLLPFTALTGLSEAQVEALVAHELAHIRRFDYFINLFQVFAETVLFYHPAVWWLNKRIRVERENCCDDAALEVCGNRIDYVRALTHLEQVRMTPQFAMAANGSPLKARVRRLLGMAEESEGVRGGGSMLGAMAVAGLVLAASSLGTTAKASDQRPFTPAAPGPPAATPAVPEVAPTPATPAVDVQVPAITPRAKPSAVVVTPRLAPMPTSG